MKGRGSLAMRQPVSINRVMKTLLEELDLDTRLQEVRIFAEWKEIVGEAVAQHAVPQEIKNGVLTVTVDSSVWLTELSRFYRHDMLSKIKERFGETLVRRITLKIGEAG